MWGLDISYGRPHDHAASTESKVIFLQQLGRGLRAAEGKTRLIVIDFVGNHRVFAQRIRHLLSLNGEDASWHDVTNWAQRFTTRAATRLFVGCNS